MLVLEALSRRFGDKLVVNDVSLSIERGAFVGVIGRSGAGKSTLLRLINRLVEPSAGRICFDGAEVTAFTGRALRAWRARCAMVFQQFNLVGRLDVLDNVLVGRLNAMPSRRALLKLWSRDEKAIALSALEQFDMGGFAARRADRLSGGQQQRVAIARALVQEPDVILADEPVASLDPRNAKIVMDALADINRRFGITILCSLHSLDLARAYCDRLVGMADGRIVFDGRPFDLTEDVARPLYGLEAGEVLDADPRAERRGPVQAVPAKRAVAGASRH